MLSYLLSRSHEPGRRPGKLVDPEPEERVGGLTIYRMDFGGGHSPQERRDTDFEPMLEPLPDASDHALAWLHFQGDVSAAQLTRLGKKYDLHPLALEDVLNRGQRPKIDVYRDTLFMTLALPHVVDHAIAIQQISLFIGPNYVLSFHAGRHDAFAAVRERIHAAHGRITYAESDYLGYCLADVVVDSGFVVLARYNDELDGLEETVFDDRSDDLVGAIHDIRRRLIGLRKVLLSQNEALMRLVGLEHRLIHADNRPYFRDMQDHAKRVLDLCDGYRDTAASLLDTHLSLASARMNDVMRVLTLIATVFMPLSFLVGVYGMNFDTKYVWNMPELSYRYGYPILLGVMIVAVIAMLIYFRRKRWL
ncbi:magnesium/cobalt transporter CorA [Salinisphaera sp.]|uniref:magnesium/cobalt transporter CorA n=1 Tax=Salinisphaera sp. TaxID=1914330 RepID=UPI002D767EC3|nr:magnesium/cobalt transporter CorA [Salinisphaera sp.]HET7315213.1 magnesium/cobalt transporter CorA [Salinisphaera sp.]